MVVTASVVSGRVERSVEVGMVVESGCSNSVVGTLVVRRVVVLDSVLGSSVSVVKTCVVVNSVEALGVVVKDGVVEVAWLVVCSRVVDMVVEGVVDTCWVDDATVEEAVAEVACVVVVAFVVSCVVSSSVVDGWLVVTTTLVVWCVVTS